MLILSQTGCIDISRVNPDADWSESRACLQAVFYPTQRGDIVSASVTDRIRAGGAP